MAEDNDDAIPYCVATGDIKKLVSFFTGRGQLRQALIIAQVQRTRLKGRDYGKQRATSEVNENLFNRQNWNRHFRSRGSFFFRELVRETSARLKPPLSTTRQTTWITDNNTRGIFNTQTHWRFLPLVKVLQRDAVPIPGAAD